MSRIVPPGFPVYSLNMVPNYKTTCRECKNPMLLSYMGKQNKHGHLSWHFQYVCHISPDIFEWPWCLREFICKVKEEDQ